jgi:undecaprenyl-diphosphatase
VLTDVISSGLHDLAGRSELLDGIMRFAAQYLIYAVVVAGVALWLHPAGLRAGLAALIGGLAAVGIGNLIGAVWTEARPFVAEHYTPLIAHAAEGSFPSDHLLLLGGLAGGIWFGARRIALGVAAIAAVIAFARVYAGIHYAGDVTAGFLIGFGCGALAWHLLRLAAPLIDRLDDQLRRRHLRPILLSRTGS